MAGTEQDGTKRWVAEHLEDLWGMSRRAREASAQLDGALTAGQSSSPGTLVGFSLKYEVGAGLLEELADVVVLAQRGTVPASARVDELGRMAWDARHLIANDLRAITNASYAESPLVERARFALRDLADGIDGLLLDLLHEQAERTT